MLPSLKLRNQIEAALAIKIPNALTPAQQVIHHLTASGIRTMDEILQGGLPCSAITELVGLECSGRTSMALAYLAAVLKSGSVCAWIDVSDALDPETAAANDVDLERLLWVRCGPRQQNSSQSVLEVGQSTSSTEVISASQPSNVGCSSTPRVTNPSLSWRSEHREEQVNSDRLPPRRGDNLALQFAIAPHCVQPQPRRKSLPTERSFQPDPFRTGISAVGKSWQALDQALRATDLLLQGGGFGVIVLDLGSMPAEVVWRIPLATWFRFRVACKRTRISLLLLTQHPCARSSAELVVRLETGSMEAESKVLTGIRYNAAAERSRNHEKNSRVVPIRKGPQSERSICKRPGEWTSQVAWVHAR